MKCANNIIFIHLYLCMVVVDASAYVRACGARACTNGWTAVVRVLRWLDWGDQGTMMVGLQWSGYYDGWTTVVRVLRWLDCSGEGTQECYHGWTEMARVLRRLV